MKTLRVYPTSINEKAIMEAVQALEKGEIIIYPTDTLYALGCDATKERAIERLCRLKGIDPKRNTLSITCADMSQAAAYARIDNRAFSVIRRHTPGPFTFILPAATTLPKLFKGRREVGIRIPDNPVARALAAALGHPLMTTSVAASESEAEEMISPDTLAHAFEPVATLLIDSGEGSLQGSAIIDLTDSSAPLELRSGPLPFQP